MIPQTFVHCPVCGTSLQVNTGGGLRCPKCGYVYPVVVQ